MDLREKISSFCFLCICLVVINNLEAKKHHAMCQKYTKEACSGNFTPFQRRARSLYSHGRASFAKIIGGKVINDSKLFPHMATLGNPTHFGEWYCGASLISENFLLTAAQCLDVQNVSYVRLGDADLRQSYDDRDVIVAKVLETIYHPWYSKTNISTYFADIALIRIEPIKNFTQNVRPICLYTNKTVNANKTFAVTGWGKKIQDGDASSKIRYAEINQVDPSLCSKRIGDFDNKAMVCAGTVEGGRDACDVRMMGWPARQCANVSMGDAGGPLQMNYADELSVTCDSPIYALVGIISNVGGCAEPNKPNMYTRVSYYMDWIEKNVWPSTTT